MLWYPYTPQKNIQHPLNILRAKGEFLYDDTGKAYIDAISSWWVSIHGHNHPFILEAIKKQLDELDHVILAGSTHPVAEEYAEKLIDFTEKDFYSVFYSDNGSCAVEIAIKIAYQYFKNQNIEKSQILHFSSSYHGDTFGTMSVGGISIYNQTYKNLLFPSPEFVSPDCYQCPVGKKKERCREECLEEIHEYIKYNHKDIFAIILEPLIQGANGMKFYKKEVLQKLQKVCNENHILLILDEVFTGFGRTGSKFAYMEAGIKPDIIAIAKGMGGGVLPIAATLATERVYEQFLSELPSHALLHGHTMTGNPPACASALASLSLFEREKRLEDVKILEFQFKKKLFSLHKQYPEKIKNPRVLGAVACFESQSPGKLKTFLLDKGILIRPLGNTIYLAPPFTISSDSVTSIFDSLEEFMWAGRD